MFYFICFVCFFLCFFVVVSFSLSFLFLFLPCPHLSSPLLSLFSLSLGDNTKSPTRVDMSINPNTINLLAHQDYVPGELMLSPRRWRLSASVSASTLAQCLSFQMCA